MSPAALALALALAPAPATTSPSGHVSWDSATKASRAAVERAGLDKSDERSAAALVAAGLDRRELVRLLDDLVAACGQAPCLALARHEPARHLSRALGSLGTPADAPVLLRLDAHGVYAAKDALTAILTRAMADAVPRARCDPPSAAEIAAARADLHDFAVLRHHNGRLRAEAPTAAELDDLAYFFAAIADAGSAVGHAAEASAGSPLQPAPPDPESDRLAALATEARARGDVDGLVRHARAYLERLGFPGPLLGAAESAWAWGGARYSYVLRDLALGAELRGEPELAGPLYRRANPGGGMCGTSDSARWAEQVRGTIRSAERAGDCRPAVAERLLDLDGRWDRWSANLGSAASYGPARLAAAGFDLARLYRGALLTAGRDEAPAVVRAALARAPEPLRAAALARLERRGPEAWEARVFAIEGLADTAGRAGLDELVRRLPTLAPAQRRRALAAIGQAAERPGADPCDPDDLSIYGASLSNVWSRHVSPLGVDCATVLRLGDAAALARALTPWLADPDPDVREAAAVALGLIGHRAALPALRAARRDAQADRRRFASVHEAITDAIALITERSADDARWRRHDP
jgi:hypothetical protein